MVWNLKRIHITLFPNEGYHGFCFHIIQIGATEVFISMLSSPFGHCFKINLSISSAISIQIAIYSHTCYCVELMSAPSRAKTFGIVLLVSTRHPFIRFDGRRRMHDENVKN